jgi:predicted NBD/HSP70 family sugar kinase
VDDPVPRSETVANETLIEPSVTTETNNSAGASPVGGVTVTETDEQHAINDSIRSAATAWLHATALAAESFKRYFTAATYAEFDGQIASIFDEVAVSVRRAAERAAATTSDGQIVRRREHLNLVVGSGIDESFEMPNPFARTTVADVLPSQGTLPTASSPSKDDFRDPFLSAAATYELSSREASTRSSPRNFNTAEFEGATSGYTNLFEDISPATEKEDSPVMNVI